MIDGSSEARLHAQVRVACGRITGGAAAILEAHRLGVAEGPHEKPWTIGYHRDAVHIYAESLPPWYQSDIAALFSRSARTMAGCLIPARIAEDWVIVTDYMVSARTAILKWSASVESRPDQRASTSAPTVDEQETPPLVIRFDALARLTTSDGARRLEQAAISVRQHMEAPVPEVLDEREIELLKRLADGAAIVDLAAELGYSERSVYRALASLWKKLGVPGRKEGVRKASSAGLLD